MRKQLYIDLQTALENITKKEGNKDVAIFQHFDLWNQNVDFLEQDTPFARPAIFVEFMPIQWKTIGAKVQEAALVIKLHIVTDWFEGTAKYNPTQSAALDYLDLPDKVIAAIQNITVNGSGSLTRTQSVINHNHHKYVDSIEEYTAYIKDSSAAVELTPIATKPTIKIVTNA